MPFGPGIQSEPFANLVHRQTRGQRVHSTVRIIPLARGCRNAGHVEYHCGLPYEVVTVRTPTSAFTEVAYTTTLRTKIRSLLGVALTHRNLMYNHALSDQDVHGRYVKIVKLPY